MKRFAVVLLLLILAGFGYGLNRLFSLRFESGDIYPAYSSFRTDPLGTLFSLRIRLSASRVSPPLRDPGLVAEASLP